MPIALATEDYALWPSELPRPSYEQIRDAVFYCIGSPAIPLGKDASGVVNRKPPAVLARTLVGAVCHRCCGMSGPEVADAIGVSSHSTFVGQASSWAGYLLHAPGGMSLYNRVVHTLVKQQRAKFGGAS